MSELVGKILSNLYHAEGQALLSDPRQLQAHLIEMCPDEDRAIRLVLLGLAQKIHQSFETDESTSAVISQETLNLQKQHHLHYLFAAWIVETWAIALGKIPATLTPRNVFAEAEQEYRTALKAVLIGELNPTLKAELHVLQNQLLLSDQQAERVQSEVYHEYQCQSLNLRASQLSALLNRPIETAWGMCFVKIDPGTFLMGSPDYEFERESDEAQHPVEITQAYYLQTTPVTQRQWQEIMGNNPSDFKDPDRPVENVSWNEIVTQFIPRLNQKGKGTYRLPTEAEWEYAARAGTSQAYSQWENASHLDTYAWYKNNSQFETQPVAQKSANAWGLYDVFGNVWEWCQDWYREYYREPEVDPQGPLRGQGRVMRGGSWFGDSESCRSAARGYMPPEARIRLIGFRLLREDNSLLAEKQL